MVSATQGRHGGRISASATPSADGKATVRELPAESQSCSPEPLDSSGIMGRIAGAWLQAVVQ